MCDDEAQSPPHPATSTADALVQRARKGDDSAIGELLVRHQPAIRALVRLKAGALLGQESASDLAQSICREVLGSLDTFRSGGEEAFRRWLHTLAIRKIQDRHRHNLAERRDVRRETPVETQSAWGEACTAFATPSGHAMGKEAEERLDEAFASLTEEQQNVVIWARFMQLSHGEIATRIEKSEAATRKILSRALARLSDVVT